MASNSVSNSKPNFKLRSECEVIIIKNNNNNNHLVYAATLRY